jgi:hypothetical protein
MKTFAKCINYSFMFTQYLYAISKSYPNTGLYRPRGFQEVEAHRFQDSWRMKVVRLSYALAAFTPRKYFWYSFLLEAELTPGPQCSWKDYINEKFE